MSTKVALLDAFLPVATLSELKLLAATLERPEKYEKMSNLQWVIWRMVLARYGSSSTCS